MTPVERAAFDAVGMAGRFRHGGVEQMLSWRLRMPRATDLLNEKSRLGAGDVATIDPLATVIDAARLMNERRIGALVVLDHENRLVGMFTERDVMVRVVAEERNPRETRVGDVMTKQVIACRPDTPSDDLRALMREKRIRHVPIVEDGAVIGMVSIGDLNIADVKVMTETISYLEQYMYSA